MPFWQSLIFQEEVFYQLKQFYLKNAECRLIYIEPNHLGIYCFNRNWNLIIFWIDRAKKFPKNPTILKSTLGQKNREYSLAIYVCVYIYKQYIFKYCFKKKNWDMCHWFIVISIQFLFQIFKIKAHFLGRKTSNQFEFHDNLNF